MTFVRKTKPANLQRDLLASDHLLLIYLLLLELFLSLLLDPYSRNPDPGVFLIVGPISVGHGRTGVTILLPIAALEIRHQVAEEGHQEGGLC